MRTMFRASLALASLSLSASAFAAGAPAAAAGTATGTLTANDKAATVKLAQAVKTADGWIVKISDVAPPDNERTPDTYGPNKIAFDVAFKASVKK